MNKEKKSLILAGSLGASLALPPFPLYYVGKELHNVSLLSNKIDRLKLIQNLFKNPIFSVCFAIINIAAITAIISLTLLILEFQGHRKSQGSFVVPLLPSEVNNEQLITAETQKANNNLTNLINLNSSVLIEQQPPVIENLTTINSKEAYSSKNSLVPMPPSMPLGPLPSKPFLTAENYINNTHKINSKCNSQRNQENIAISAKISSPTEPCSLTGNTLRVGLARLRKTTSIEIANKTNKTDSEDLRNNSKIQLEPNNMSFPSNVRKFNIETTTLSTAALVNTDFNTELAAKLRVRRNKTENKTEGNKTEGFKINVEASKTISRQVSFIPVQSFNEVASTIATTIISNMHTEAVAQSSLAVNIAPPAPPAMPIGPLYSVSSINPSESQKAKEVVIENNSVILRQRKTSGSKAARPLSDIMEEALGKHRNPSTGMLNLQGLLQPSKYSRLTLEEEQKQKQKLEVSKKAKRGYINNESEEQLSHFLNSAKFRILAAQHNKDESESEQDFSEDTDPELTNFMPVRQTFTNKRALEQPSEQNKVCLENTTSRSDPLAIATIVSADNAKGKALLLANSTMPREQIAKTEATLALEQQERAWVEINTPKSPPPPSRGAGKTSVMPSLPLARVPINSELISSNSSEAKAAGSEISSLANIVTSPEKIRPPLPAKLTFSGKTQEPLSQQHLPALASSSLGKAITPVVPLPISTCENTTDSAGFIALIKTNEQGAAPQAKVKRGFWEGKIHKIAKETKKATNILGLASSSNNDNKGDNRDEDNRVGPASNLSESNVSQLVSFKKL